MARGDCQNGFKAAAAEDGIKLVGQSLPWLSQGGHLHLEHNDETAHAIATLAEIYVTLGGDLDTLSTASRRLLPGDFVHVETGTLIEIDESQHFTTARLTTLDLYPADVTIGYDLDEYKSLCRRWSGEADNYFRTKPARGFGHGGRQRQRAYYDALRDLAAPAMGHPPTIRIAAPTRDGRAAYTAHQDRLISLRPDASL